MSQKIYTHKIETSLIIYFYRKFKFRRMLHIMWRVLSTTKRQSGYNDFVSFFMDNKLIILLSIINTITDEDLKKLNFLFITNFKERNFQSNYMIFASSFSSIFLFTILIILTSLSIMGSIFIPIIIFFRGKGLGITAGYLYALYGIKGIGYHLLILLPGIFISSLAIIIISVRGIYFSNKLLRKVTPRPYEESLWPYLLIYLKSTSKNILILSLSSLLDTLTMMLFSKFFIF